MGLLLLWNGSVQGTAGTFPTIYLEWSPTTGPRDVPIWERIPLADIRSIDINRGRNRELDQFQAGRMTVVLDNRDRLYDPMYSAGTNFGNVKPMKRIRLTAVWDRSYYLFTGFVDSWDQDYDMTKEAICTVTSTDGFKVWADADQFSAYGEEIQADLPTAWWRLNESLGSTHIFDTSGNGHTLAVNGAPTFAAAGLNEFDSDTAVTTTAVTQGFQTFAAATLPVTSSFTVEGIIQTTATTNQLVIAAATAAFDTGFEIDTNVSLGKLFFAIKTAAGGSTSFSSNATVNDGEPHHFVATWQAGGTLSLYIDGALDNTTTNTGTTIGTTGYTLIGGGSIPNITGGMTAVSGMVGTYDEFAIYDHVLSAADVTRHHEALIAPWNGDTTGERIERLADAIGWPAADRDIDTGDSTLQSADLGGSALAHAQLVRDTEYGEFFFLPNGSVRFIGRQNKWLPPYSDPLFTLSDDGSDLSYGRLKFNYDDQLIRNRVTVGYDNGIVFTANSTSSQDDFLIKSYSKTSLIGDVDSEAVDYANYILGRYDEPLLRVEGISITPQKAPATMWPSVLAADLVYQVNVERTPQGIGTAIDQDYTVEGVSHHIEPKFWRTELQLSPADTPGAFILDSTSQGILDTNTLGF